jgi:hypothetical protein
MAVYFITGKLGSGKTLVSVGKIRDALQEGRKVATNLELRLQFLVGPQAKKCVVYRLPDKPVATDMFALGSGNDTYDEEKNGLIVLDECGTWFNARDWQDRSRKALIDWLLHARKLGWDILFIIQDVSMIDKQARKSICEHVVYCRRLDRLSIPILDTVAKLVRKKGIPKPKLHLAIVKYGDLPNSLTVDKWLYRGTDLYRAYDTKQAFIEDYPHTLFQVLPPYFSHGRYSVPMNMRNIMRLTKIYLRRFSQVLVLGGGLTAGAFAGAYINQPEPVDIVTDVTTVTNPVSPPEESSSKNTFLEKKDIPLTIAQKFEGFIIQGVAMNQQKDPIFVQVVGPEKQKYNLQSLRASGYVVRMVDSCQVLIMNLDRSESVRLHTSYCSPGKPALTLSKFNQSSSQEQYQRKLEQVIATERSLKTF